MNHVLSASLRDIKMILERQYKPYMKEKELPDNLEDAIILSFLWAEYFVQKFL